MKISTLSKIFLIIAAILLIGSLFVPLWRIDLEAPQYPEGLNLLIYANKIAGNVDIINGLNHYIGMQTLHAENFIEFTVLQYIIGAFALLFIITAIIGKRKLLYATFIAFAAFGVIAIADFWRWEYNYGHHLDPNAPIIVPGMAYQPPLIGFKQLLNFGAYSMPDIGGYFFIICGIILLALVGKESGFFNRFSSKKSAYVKMMYWSLGWSVLMASAACSGEDTPTNIAFNRDMCDYCKMKISDQQFAAQLKTEKGRYYKFDDIFCLQSYRKEHDDVNYKALWISDYAQAPHFVAIEQAHFVRSPDLKTPMGGGIAAFADKADAEKLAQQHHTQVLNWKSLNE